MNKTLSYVTVFIILHNAFSSHPLSDLKEPLYGGIPRSLVYISASFVIPVSSRIDEDIHGAVQDR